MGSEGTGTTHAWAEVYVSGAGWITFDPTNRSVGGANLIPVAVGRDIRQVMPVAGSFVGMSDAFEGMSVEVCVGSTFRQSEQKPPAPSNAGARYSGQSGMTWTAREPHFEQMKGRDRGCIGGAFCVFNLNSWHLICAHNHQIIDGGPVKGRSSNAADLR